MKSGVMDAVRLFLFSSEVSSSQSPVAEAAEVLCPTQEDRVEQTCSFSWALQSWSERDGSKESSGCCVSQPAVTVRVNRRFAKLHSYVMIQFFKVLATFFQLVFDSMKPFFLLLPSAVRISFVSLVRKWPKCDLTGSSYFFLKVVCVWPYMALFHKSSICLIILLPWGVKLRPGRKPVVPSSFGLLRYPGSPL